MATNITYHASTVTYSERCSLLSQTGTTIWLTGLSASGKSTIATALEKHLLEFHHKSAFRLDGDNIRFGLNQDLGFSEKDRQENIRRIAHVSVLLASSSTISITAFISPYKFDRQLARKLHQEQNIPFIEVFIDASLEECENRDPKGLYKKARAGKIQEFTGISAPYEAPESPEIHINAGTCSIQDSVQQITDYLIQKGYLTV